MPKSGWNFTYTIGHIFKYYKTGKTRIRHETTETQTINQYKTMKFQ